MQTTDLWVPNDSLIASPSNSPQERKKKNLIIFNIKNLSLLEHIFFGIQMLWNGYF